jgi:CHAT domain-containing protein
LFSTVNACESKGELNKIATFPLKKNQCHQFTLNKESVNYLQITVRQNGVDVELRLFENDREIKSTDSENLNSGFEFLPFITSASSNYILQVRWVDDNQTMIKNEGFYTLEVESRALAQQDKIFVEQFEKAKSFYDKATAERLNGNKNNAVNMYLSAIEIYQSLAQTKSVRYRLFLTNYYLGVSYILLKKYPEALTVFEKIRPSAAENEDKYLENLVLKELGIAYFKTGNYQKSDEVLASVVKGFEQSVSESIGEKQALASAYINQAETFLQLNKIEQAITSLENVRANFNETISENLLASLKLADIYLELGNHKKAEEIIVSLSISENLPDYIKGVFYKISGKLYMKSDKEKALNFFNKAKLLFNGNEDESAQLLIFFGNTHYYAKDYASAKPFYEQAKSSFERQNNLSDMAQVLNNLGVIYYIQKEYAPAIASCENALIINTEIQSDLNQARNLINLMYFHEIAGNDSSAIFYGKWAINTIQSIKYLQLQSLEKEIQDNFRNSFADAFRKLANLLIKAGRISEAEQVLHFIKEKEYQDYIRGEGKSSVVDYTKYEEKLLEDTKNKIKEKSSLQIKSTENSSSNIVSPTKNLIEELKIQKVNVSEILFVSTLVTENSISIIATNDKTQKVYVQNISREKLNKLVFEFRESVTDIEKNPKIEGKQLYDILVKPMEKDMLSPKTRKIVWSLDGVLRYVPLPALFDGENYLVQRFANIQLTLASEEKILMPKSLESSVIGFASSKPFENLSSLPNAKNELDCIFEDEKRLIINSTCKKGIIRGKKVVDEEFTQDVFEDALKRYKLIHLTSHFVMQTGDNSKSFLLLGGGKDRKYTMQTFSKQQLDNTEILIMSACNTANFSSDGAEFESFATMAQKQGAKAVIGTLWSVADDSTSKFMTEFYRLFELKKLDKAEAIRLAQINVSRNKNYSHPFYWSPFVLFGNWK